MRSARVTAVLAIAGGLLWPVAMLLRHVEPSWMSYDAANRLLTLPILLLLAATWRLASESRRQGDRVWRAGIGLGVVGFIVLLVGNALEFWGVLLQDKPNAAAASGTGVEPWWGSHVGWIVFGVGMLTLLLAAACLLLAPRRPDAWPRPRALGLAAGFLVLVGFLHPLSALAFGLAWAWNGRREWLEAPRPSRQRS